MVKRLGGGSGSVGEAAFPFGGGERPAWGLSSSCVTPTGWYILKEIICSVRGIGAGKER